ncbi:MAG: hypothetical protein MHM6MM_002971 [Cercozoa sp. M6MM]
MEALFEAPPSRADAQRARRLFYGGFVLMPVLWMLCVAQYGRMAKHRGASAHIRRSVRWSKYMAFLATLAFIVYVVYFYLENPFGTAFYVFDLRRDL